MELIEPSAPITYSTSSTTSTSAQDGGKGEVRTWLDGLNSPLIQDEGDKKLLKLRFDVSQYSPEEIIVKTVDNKLLEVVGLKGGKSTGWGLEVVQIKAGGRGEERLAGMGREGDDGWESTGWRLESRLKGERGLLGRGLQGAERQIQGHKVIFV
uniref:Uncharacterized protein n=1 Tax=Timema tahoe TaxID=61484 RepID=A0A7R9IEW0_9NEOP|nr:unnamed protein product [Timema tahoe]